MVLTQSVNQSIKPCPTILRYERYDTYGIDTECKLIHTALPYHLKTVYLLGTHM